MAIAACLFWRVEVKARLFRHQRRHGHLPPRRSELDRGALVRQRRGSARVQGGAAHLDARKVVEKTKRSTSLTHAHAYSSLVRRLRAVRAGICTRASPQTNPLPPTNPSLFFYQRFREFQHVAVVRVSLVQLDGRELGVVPRAQAFVAPNPPQLKHFFKPAHHLFRILARARPAAAAARAPAQRGVRTKLRTRASKQTNTN